MLIVGTLDTHYLNGCYKDSLKTALIMQIVQEYGAVGEELHYFRLKLNRAPETLEEMLKLINSTSNIDDNKV